MSVTYFDMSCWLHSWRVFDAVENVVEQPPEGRPWLGSVERRREQAANPEIDKSGSALRDEDALGGEGADADDCRRRFRR